MNGTDEMYRRLLEAVPGDLPFPALRRAGFAAFNHEPGEFVAAGDARGIAFSGLYGMSEVQALFAARDPGEPAAARARAGGRPVAFAAQVRARDPETGRILPDGEAGELEISGPSLMREYFADPEATAAALTADGFLRSGDLGFTEAGGGFTFLARMGDALRLAGHLVNPVEISSHIETLAGVAACQVVGVRTPGGEKAVAFVIARPGGGLEAEAIARHCRDGLAGFKIPAAILFLDAFPMAESANGAKVQRAKLRALAAEALLGAPGAAGSSERSSAPGPRSRPSA
jgi:fatty-acyl-CoA synthase